MAPDALPPCVLIADADPYISRVFEAKLTKEHSFQAVGVTTGQEAYQAALRQLFTVLLWDMRLRETRTLLPRLRALCPGAVLLLMTTDDRPTLDSDLMRLDIMDVLIKPLNLDTLVERVHTALEMAPFLEAAPVEMTRIGQSIRLSSSAGACMTRVLEKRQDSLIVVGAPRVETPPDFAPGLAIQVQIPGDDALYSFASKLLRVIDQPVASWEVQKASVILREQRRKHLRLPLRLAISLEEISANTLPRPEPTPEQIREPPNAEAETPIFGDAVYGLTEDVAQGGCAVVTDRLIAPGTPVRFVLEGPSRPLIEGNGAIVRAQPVYARDAVRSRYRLAVRFSRLPAPMQRRLRTLLETTA